jgi:hypothetical protein
MKRVDLIRHLERHGCEFPREGRRHTAYVNRKLRGSSAIVRHPDVNDFLARRICDAFRSRVLEDGWSPADFPGVIRFAPPEFAANCDPARRVRVTARD